MTNLRKAAARRPAELGTGIAGAVVAVLVWVFGVDPPPSVVGALIALVAATPAGITWLVETIRKD